MNLSKISGRPGSETEKSYKFHRLQYQVANLMSEQRFSATPATPCNTGSSRNQYLTNWDTANKLDWINSLTNVIINFHHLVHASVQCTWGEEGDAKDIPTTHRKNDEPQRSTF